ncbi:MAG: UDP-N-acetylmuramate dehydrogenase [Bdellovibrionaceae bacterium]|nr:UDP-N-acetylmuramate dehydrogenase [Pseudobdellovibrionaceae bacterium]
MENRDRIVPPIRPSWLQENVCLKNYNTWRVGGEAQFFCRPPNLEILKEAVLWAHQNQFNLTLLGGGSNVLISDRGVQGLVICTKDYSKIEETYVKDNKFFIRAQAGTKKGDLLKYFLQRDLAPALFLAGLPGDVAGGVVMNAGVREKIQPREFVEIVEDVEVLKLENNKVIEKKFLKNDIHWSYRHSSGWQPGVIFRVTMAWQLQPDSELKNKVRQANQLRLQKQPLKQPSCGSTFRNPQGDSAGRLIEQAGLKGFKIGGAQISEKHANFIVTEDGASAQDVSSVMDHVVNRVRDLFKIELQSEVVRLGDW